ncbi:MAG: hypothetical protein ACP5LZ_07485 [Fervidicoccaceae archaeon]
MEIEMEKEQIQMYNLGKPTESIAIKQYTFVYDVENRFEDLKWEKRGRYYVLDIEFFFNLLSQSEELDMSIAEDVASYLHLDWIKYGDIFGYDRDRVILCHDSNPCSCLQIGNVKTPDPNEKRIKLYITISHIVFDDVGSCVVGEYYEPVEIWSRGALVNQKMGSGVAYFSIIQRRFILPESMRREENEVYLKYKLAPGTYIHIAWDYFDPTYRIIAKIVKIEYDLSKSGLVERTIARGEWHASDKHEFANVILSDFFKSARASTFSLDFDKIYSDEDVDVLLGIIEDLDKKQARLREK